MKTFLGIALSLVIGVAIFVVAAVIGLELASRDRVLPGVAVLGVPVGGLTVQDAAARLGPASAEILDQPLSLRVGDRTWTITPRGAGLKLDPSELAQSAYRIGHGSSTLANVGAHLAALRTDTGVPITSTADGTGIQTLIAGIAAEVDTQPRAAVLQLADDGTVTYQTSQTGLALDQTAARQLVAQALTEGRASVELPTRTLEPTQTTDQVVAAHDQLVRILADPAPIRVNAGQQQWTIDRPQLLEIATLTQPQGPTAPATVELHDEPIQTLLDTIATRVNREPDNARFTWDGSRPTLLRKSADGQTLNQAVALDRIKNTIQSGARSVDLPVDVAHPAVGDDAGPRLGIREVLGESTTSFAGSIPEKAANIKLAAERLNGVVVPPGGTFSFNKEVGPTTLEAGFQWGFGLTTGSGGGVHTVPSVAGGICQVATTLFQPVFWSGYQIEERYWHLYWIPAYTSRGVVGLDATVDSDSGLDLKWINPTDQPVLIQTSTDAEHVTFRLLGQKPPWTVKVDDAIITEKVVADPTPEVQAEPSLPWGRTLLVESARDGFTVVLNRHVTPTGSGQPRDLALKSVYAPAHTVTLVGTGGAPDAAQAAAAVDRLRASQQRPAAPRAAAPAAPAANPAPAVHQTPNGPRTLTQIRDELRNAGWGGGSDQDALETYQRLAAAAHH